MCLFLRTRTLDFYTITGINAVVSRWEIYILNLMASILISKNQFLKSYCYLIYQIQDFIFNNIILTIKTIIKEGKEYFIKKNHFIKEYLLRCVFLFCIRKQQNIYTPVYIFKNIFQPYQTRYRLTFHQSVSYQSMIDLAKLRNLLC